MSQKIIVTGGAGYIGSHTCVALIESGFDVVVLDNLSNSVADSLAGVEKITGKKPDFINVDCTDIGALRDAFALHRDAVGVIHFAALKAVGESVEKPLLYYRNNLGGLINVLDLFRTLYFPRLQLFMVCLTHCLLPKKRLCSLLHPRMARPRSWVKTLFATQCAHIRNCMQRCCDILIRLARIRRV